MDVGEKVGGDRGDRADLVEVRDSWVSLQLLEIGVLEREVRLGLSIGK